MTNRKDITQQSALLSSYLATDIITRLRNPKKEVGHAVRAITLALENYSESSFRDLLSMCRVCLHRNTTRNKCAKEVCLIAEKGLPSLNPRDGVIAMVDNIQWKLLFGDNAGTYDHWVAVAFRIVPEAQLIKDGFYTNGDIPGFSRKRLDWGEMILDLSSESILDKYVRPSSDDVDVLCNLMCIHISAALSLRENFYTIEEIELINNERYDPTSYMVDTDEKQLPLLHRVLIERHLDVILQGETRDDTASDESTAESQKLSTLWERNNIMSSFPIKMVFATNEAVCECLEMCKRIADKQVSEFDAVDNNDDLDRPVSERCVGLAGDGVPWCKQAS
jgi:hypothetical protein